MGRWSDLLAKKWFLRNANPLIGCAEEGSTKRCGVIKGHLLFVRALRVVAFVRGSIGESDGTGFSLGKRALTDAHPPTASSRLNRGTAFPSQPA